MRLRYSQLAVLENATYAMPATATFIAVGSGVSKTAFAITAGAVAAFPGVQAGSSFSLTAGAAFAAVGQQIKTGVFSLTAGATAAFPGLGVQGAFAIRAGATFMAAASATATGAYAITAGATVTFPGELIGVFKPEWALNSNRVFGPPSPEIT